MKAFIERVFKSKKLKQEKEVKEQATEAMVEAIIEEVKQEIKKEKHIDCECEECLKGRRNNA